MRQLTVHADLVPEAAYRRDYEARAKSQRVWALAVGGTGVALAGVATGLLIWNETRYADWRDEDRALARALESREGDPEQLQRRQDLNNDALTSIQHWEVAAAIAGAAGVLMTAAGAVLFFSGDDPDRYQALDVKLAPGAITVHARGTL